MFMKKPVIITLTILLVLLVSLVYESVFIIGRADPLRFNHDPSTLTDPGATDGSAVKDYQAYLDRFEAVFPDVAPIVINAADPLSMDGDHEIMAEYEGVFDVLLMDEIGSVTWEFPVDEAGFYRVLIDYYPYPGKSSVIERAVKINGDIPFDGARNITFPRIWGSESDIIQDIHGNDIRPRQIETPMWTDAYFRDAIGYVSRPYVFYFPEGANTLTLTSVREPLMIDQIVLESVRNPAPYAEIKAHYDEMGYTIADGNIRLIEAEDAIYTTSPTLYPLNDRTSPLTSPNDPGLIKLNTIGGYNWRVAGDRITWSFTVEQTGLYAISLRVKQKQANGISVGRNIYINGEIPFAEMENFAFRHANDWRIQTLGTPDEPYLFYFEAGRSHSLTMEVTLGAYGPLIARIQDAINNLNKLYREILIYTGPEPDPFRDYQLHERIDDLSGRLMAERDNLSDVRERIIAISGTTSEKTGILDTVLLQLDFFLRRPRELHRNLNTYNGNISSLGTLVILLSTQPLEIDYFLFHDTAEQLPASRAGFFHRFWFNFMSFAASFFIDYSSIGKTSVSDDDESIEVWISIGRDQANVLRRLIDESFTRQTGIQVDLKLVDGGVLLPATLSGVGPDVAMGIGPNVPVNYAMRNAVHDLSTFPDFEDVASRFKYSAMLPFHYEGGYFALPEQQIWMMLFYRTDIFDELGLTPPDTWEDVIHMIPDLQKLNLEFFMPVPIRQGNVIDLPPNPVFSSMFYQVDGEFYINNNNESGFNEGLGPMVFELWTRFYTDYSFPVEANFVNRFRSGQMPIGLAYYNTYNILSVFAPEIRGRWNFIPIPGTRSVDEHGNPIIRRDTVATGSGIMIMEQSEKKDASWEYLKWWTSTEIQVRFGREMEGILGAAARYPTANVEALSQLPWTVIEYQMLLEQWEWVRGVPEVPGGYMTGRHLDNAFRLVLEERANPRETIYDYVQVINEEIRKKRREFGLDTG
ncbi:MAG: extracellular solute-binding protein [Acholeplasmataceae bacterium]|nr:MAG: extracellular solute-binding protein [Acholeplasmataceae bacterium]